MILPFVLGGGFVGSACAQASGDPANDPTADRGPSSSGAGGFSFGVGGDSAGGPKIGCSPDLQRVVDSAGTVLEKCADDQGCFEGQCIAACEAASRSKGSIGCDFWAPDPPFFGNGQPAAIQHGPCYAVFVANAWTRPAQITISRGDQNFDVTQYGRIPKGIVPDVTYEPIPATGLPPNEVAVLFLSHRPGTSAGAFTPDCTISLECPVTPALLADGAVQGSGRGAAFRVTSDTPVSAYDILPYGGATSLLPSATLLFPSTAWGNNYYAVSPHPNDNGKLWSFVVGAQDGTTVKVNPKATLPGGTGVAPAPADQTTSYTLNAGEILQWMGADPTSAIIESDKPIGLWTGSTYLAVQTANMGPGGHESEHQELPHIKALGSEYLAAGVVSRLPSHEPESVLYRVLGVVNGTELEFDPQAPTAGVTLNGGQVFEFETAEPFRVRSQDDDHPFALTQYMSGSTLYPTVSGCGDQFDSCGVNLSCELGDEEWISLVPSRQYLQRYVFFTDPTYATTNLVVTRIKGPEGFRDVELACLGKLTGWKPIGSSGLYEYAYVDLVRGGAPLGSCGTSQHVATSDGPFGVVVWGTDWYSSYGYPAGGNAGTLNNVEVPPPK